MNDKFDIIEYLSGLTGYVFDKAVLKSIAFERDVVYVTSFDELDQKTIDLLRADLLYRAWLSPNVWASSTNKHGGFTRTVGSQTIYATEKERLYDIFMGIYRKYDDEKISEISDSGTLQWID